MRPSPRPPLRTLFAALPLLLAGCAPEPAGDAAQPEAAAALADSTVEFVAVSAGFGHTCAVARDGRVYCAGANFARQLGVPATRERCPVPWSPGEPDGCSTYAVPVDGRLRFTAVDVGSEYSCGLTREGEVACWGSAQYGELGSTEGMERCTYRGEGYPCRAAPLPVAGVRGAAGLAAGNSHACTLTAEGEAFCWGINAHRQLGAPPVGQPCAYEHACARTPVGSGGGRRFAALAVGQGRTCGLSAAGEAYCWGGNGHGELLGNGGAPLEEVCGREPCTSAPVAIAGGVRFASLSTGSSAACGLTAGGEAYCWGRNHSGELGDGGMEPSGVPVRVAAQARFRALSVGSSHACGVAEGGEAWCWGANEAAQLGASPAGPVDERPSPLPVGGGLRFTALSAGSSHTCGVTPEGQVFCWGSDSYGQLGDGPGARESCGLDEQPCSGAPVRFLAALAP